MNISLSAFARENLVSRDGFGSPVPRQPAHLHTQAESGAYFRDSSRVPRRRPFIDIKPPYAIGSVPSLSPRVRRHRASKPQGSSGRVLPWQVTINQIICASLSHTHYWYEAITDPLHATLKKGFCSTNTRISYYYYCNMNIFSKITAMVAPVAQRYLVNL